MKQSRMSPEVITQRELAEAYRKRGRVIWHGSRGTMRLRHLDIRGKSAKKATKKLTHNKGHYKRIKAEKQAALDSLAKSGIKGSTADTKLREVRNHT